MSKTDAVARELKEKYIFGRDIFASRWQERMQNDEAFAKLAGRLVWQADGRRFVPGDGFIPEGPVSLAHPVELDAGEILRWRDHFKEKGITQPFRQMWEPVVLVDGKLPGKVTSVQSAGERYRMLDRYRGFHLPLSAVTALKKEGFRFIDRRRWDENKWQKAEIQVVNVVTPAGILYECRPDKRVKTLSDKSNASLQLGMFYPFEDIRLRTLNHAAAALEECLLDEITEMDALDMLLPHLPGMPMGRLRKLRGLCDEQDQTAAVLNRLIAREGVSSC